MNDKSVRVRRGGSWRYDPLSARVAIRYNNSPGNRYSDIGIRLVEVVEDQEPVLSPFRGSSSFESSNKARTFYSSGSRTLRTPVGIRLVEVTDD